MGINVLIINSCIKPLRHDLVDFLLMRSEIDFIVILEDSNHIKSATKTYSEFIGRPKLLIKSVDFLQTLEVHNELQDLLLQYEFHHIVYNECPYADNQESLLRMDIQVFKATLLQEINKKITIFQKLGKFFKEINQKVYIYVIIPEHAQTILMDDNFVQNALFGGFHMLTTAFADEFVDYGIYCNGLLANEFLIETMHWLVFDNKELIHGKLISNKQIILW